MKYRRQLVSEGKRNTIEVTELIKTIRKKTKEEVRIYKENKVQKVVERNRSLKCLRPTLGKYVITSIKDKIGTEERGQKQISKIAEEFNASKKKYQMANCKRKL